MIRSQKTYTRILLVVALAFVLAACQTGSATETQPVPQTVPTLAETTAPTGTTAVTATTAATETTAPTAAAMAALTVTATAAPAASPDPEASPDPVAPGSVTDEVKMRFQNTGSLGQILVDERGMTLYRFTNDTPNASSCVDQCAVNWPPLLVAPGGEVEIDDMDEEGIVGTITRPDGTTQVTYKDQPLYYWINDKQPGDTSGQNVNGVWFVVNP